MSPVKILIVQLNSMSVTTPILKNVDITSIAYAMAVEALEAGEQPKESIRFAGSMGKHSCLQFQMTHLVMVAAIMSD